MASRTCTREIGRASRPMARSRCSVAGRCASTRPERRCTPRRSRRRSSATPASTTASSSGCPTSSTDSEWWLWHQLRSELKSTSGDEMSRVAANLSFALQDSQDHHVGRQRAARAQRQSRLQVGEGYRPRQRRADEHCRDPTRDEDTSCVASTTYQQHHTSRSASRSR
jgi:hypothetical protein